MAYNKIEIQGLRGFAEKGILELGIPKNLSGSGLTVIVGPNNSGKSTIFEAFRAIAQNEATSFTEGRRNKKAGDKIAITLTNTEGNSLHLATKTTGGSETAFVENGLVKNQVKCFSLPSRRTFSPFFGKGMWNRETYVNSFQLPAVRGSQLDHFQYRLFKLQDNQEVFNNVLEKVLGKIPTWNIEQADNGQYYLKFNYDGTFHNSDGTGEGLLSVFTIIDTLYDSSPGDLIFIDEPELSLHPTLQKKLLSLLLEYSTDRQIVISTHSPYFVSWNSIENGGKIARTVKGKTTTKIFQLKETTAEKILSLVNNLNNPHILGLDAKEIFFLDDNVILVEGQEDVIFLSKIFKLKNKILSGTFFGWGVGGADNTDKVVEMLWELGFEKIAAVFDNNKRGLIAPLREKYEKYFFTNIPTDDVRDKKEKGIEGLIDYGGKIVNQQYNAHIEKLCDDINQYLTSE